jgi:hypothetical protein
MHKTFSIRADRGDGLDLRALSYNGEEVSSRLYFAIRDEWWRTVPLTVHSRRSEITPAGFAVEVDAVSAWASHPMEVALRYVADGPELVAEFMATSRGSFTYRRIGFCLLLATEPLQGRTATSWGSRVPTGIEFPTTIVTRDWDDPASERFHQPFDQLDTSLASGTRVRYVFEGEEFEFEDQRNWTDASYKAYSVRPEGSWPLTTVDHMRFAQRVRVQVIPAAPNGGTSDATAIRLGPPIGVLPSVDLFRGRVSQRSYRPGGGFQELNAKRPNAGRLATYDSIELAVNGAVHAADDDSVLETTALHGTIVAQTRAAHPELPVRLAPVSFLDAPGDWRDEHGRYAPEPPAGPLPPRMLSEFAATWAIASAARIAPAGPDLVRYFDAALPADTPAARTVRRLRELAGHPVLAVHAPAPLAVLAVRTGDTVTLAVANPTPDLIRFHLPDHRESTLDGFRSAWYEVTQPSLPRQPQATQPVAS